MEVLAALRNIESYSIHGFGSKGQLSNGQESTGDKTPNFFHDRFAKPSERRANIDMRFPKTISEDQSQDLEREVSKQEIKTAVWGSLIPKVPDANLVKDFRPISLIGSIYNIIAKILSNRLVNVLGDIVNEVQSAFIAERQMLDGPFILE
ncbi:hypothetical protein Tco_0581851 [Tanacetum coccineum]